MFLMLPWQPLDLHCRFDQNLTNTDAYINRMEHRNWHNFLHLDKFLFVTLEINDFYTSETDNFLLIKDLKSG